MARLLGTEGKTVPGAGSRQMTVYSDAACTQLADIAAFQTGSPTVPGSVITGSKVTLTRTGDVPKFWFPADGTDTLWGVVARGGPTVRLNADYDARLDSIRTGLKVAEAANGTMGRATLSGGTVVVSTTAVTAASEVFLNCQVPGGTPGFLRVSTRTAGTSFTILSSSGTDTSVVGWVIIEPA